MTVLKEPNEEFIVKLTLLPVVMFPMTQIGPSTMMSMLLSMVRFPVIFTGPRWLLSAGM